MFDMEGAMSLMNIEQAILMIMKYMVIHLRTMILLDLLVGLMQIY